MLSLKEIEEEIVEKRRDLAAFSEARAILMARLLQVMDVPSNLTPLQSWSGTVAVLGSLDLSVSCIERTVAELTRMRDNLQAAEEFKSRPEGLFGPLGIGKG